MKEILTNLVRFRNDPPMYQFWVNVYNWYKLSPAEKIEQKKKFFSTNQFSSTIGGAK